MLIRKTKQTILIMLIILGIGQLRAQTITSGKISTTQTVSDVEKEPSAEMIYETQQSPNPLILQIIKMTDGDEMMTEKVIAYIIQTNPTKIKRVVTDSEFNALTAEAKEHAIKESEVTRIINLLK